jgi:exo-1,4-beta-D-glucosaminidase
VSRNLYWLSTNAETLDWEKSNWYVTPTRTFADYTALNTLPQAELQATSQSKPGETTITLTNTGKAIAFAIRLKVNKGTNGDEVLPVLWEDNYFSLLPGEAREVTATYNPRDLGLFKPAVEVDAWNCKTVVVK